VFAFVWDQIGSALRPIGAALQSAFSFLSPDEQSGALSFFEALGAGVVWLADLIGTVLKGAFIVLGPIIGFVVRIFATFFAGVISVFNVIKSFIEIIFSLFIGLFAVFYALYQLMTGDLGGAWATIKAAFMGVGEAVLGFFYSIWNGLVDMVANLVSFIPGVGDSAAEKIRTLKTGKQPGEEDTGGEPPTKAALDTAATAKELGVNIQGMSLPEASAAVAAEQIRIETQVNLDGDRVGAGINNVERRKRSRNEKQSPGVNPGQVSD